jgi:hypothetical protein
MVVSTGECMTMSGTRSCSEVRRQIVLARVVDKTLSYYEGLAREQHVGLSPFLHYAITVPVHFYRSVRFPACYAKIRFNKRHHMNAFLFSTVCALGVSLALPAATQADDVSTTQQGAHIHGLTDRVAGVPADYVATPFGHMSPHCIYPVGKNDQVTREGNIRRADGFMLKIPRCIYPRYLEDGTRSQPAVLDQVPGNAVPEPKNWQFGAQQPNTGLKPSAALKSFKAVMVVPSGPKVSVNMTPHLYLFPGISALYSQTYPVYIAPVIGWNQYLVDDLSGHGGYQPGWTYELWTFIGDGQNAMQYQASSLTYTLDSGDHVSIVISHCTANGGNCDTKPWSIHFSSNGTNEWEVEKKLSLETDDNADVTGKVTVYGAVFAMSGAVNCDSLPNQPVVTMATQVIFADNSYQGKWYPKYWHNPIFTGIQNSSCTKYVTNIQPMDKQNSYISLNFK